MAKKLILAENFVKKGWKRLFLGVLLSSGGRKKFLKGRMAHNGYQEGCACDELSNGTPHVSVALRNPFLMTKQVNPPPSGWFWK